MTSDSDRATMSSPASNSSLKRDSTVILDDSQVDSPESSQSNAESPPPKKKRKLSQPTPIVKVTPSPTKRHHHHHSDNQNDHKIAIIRCKSGHPMIQHKTSNKESKVNCAGCHREIQANEDYFKCPKNNASDSLCITCFDKEKTQYTGSIRLGQRLRIKIENEWRLGFILEHWTDDDMYSIQLDGQSRQEAQAYDIYDAFWEVQLVQNNQLKPTPTRIITQCDTDNSIRTVPRCLSGCRMMTMDAEDVYQDQDGQGSHCKKLSFDEEKDESEDEETKGIFCNDCGDYVPRGKIYHCPNETHKEGYDLCLRCSKPPPQLTSFDVKGLAQFIASDSCKKVGILCGAGISRSAGIPDFRSKDGIYKSLTKDLSKNVTKYGLTLKQKKQIEDDAQYVFSIDLFEDNPAVLYHVLADILNKRCKPTLTHCFFKLLQNRGLLKYLFTQNVDGLERYIGIDPKVLTEVHGTFLSASCHKCGEEYSIAEVRKHVLRMDFPIKCTKKECDNGYVKPNCVLFGQDLPPKYYDAVDKFKSIDLLIVLGTSLSVKPVSNLPNQVSANAIRAVFNLELNDEIKQIFEFDAQKNQRDVFIAGKCDESIEELCKLLKWEKELKQIYQTSNQIAKKINDKC
eukprot:51095_1